jgi:tight adherence protein B
LTLIFGVPLVLALVMGLPSALLPWLVVASKRERRLKALELQLPEAADLISRSLRAGHAFPATLQMLADEMPDPIASEFRIVSDEVNFGLPMADALQRLILRVPLADLQYLVVAVLIQREAGGNLSELMSKVSQMVRQRLKLLGDIRVLSAEGRLSAWILCLLPVFMGMAFSLTSPEYLKRFFDDPAGTWLLGAAGMMMFLGVLWMRMIVRVRV